MADEAKCFHVEAGKPCTRYLEGSAAEQKAVLEFLKAIPVEVIDDWGLNAVGNIIEFIEGGVARKGAWHWEQQSGQPKGPDTE